MKQIFVFALPCVFLLVGCLQTPTPQASSPALTVESAQALNARGDETAADQCMRRPTFALTTNVPVAPLDPPIFLLDGVIDDELLEDFSSPPLRAATQNRVIATENTVEDSLVHVRPLQPLVPGQTVSLVVAPWVVGTEGERWAFDDTPFTATFRVTTRADGGASVVTSWPADGTAGVPPNLMFAAIGFDGDVLQTTGTLQLTSEDTAEEVAATVGAVACVDVGLSAHRCIRLSPERTLQPSTAYRIALNGWTDSVGGVIDAWSGRFVTAVADDATAPVSVPLPCALDESSLPFGCALISDTVVSLRIALDEPALITWTQPMCAPQTQAAFAAEASLALDDLPEDTSLDLRVDVTDAAGNVLRIDDVIHTLPALPSLTITEVRADPAGPEPQQEYVELLNFGDAPIDLLGYSITDDRFDDGDVIERSVLVHPGGRVLLVADDFDAQDPRDVAPAPGVLLVRIGTSIANGGLSNSGEPLCLRDPFGTRISETPSLASTGADACLERIDAHTRDGSIRSFVHDAAHGCTPGR